MRKKLLGLVLCLGFIFLFGISNKSYEVSNIVYTESNDDLISKEVEVRGIDTTFHIIGVEDNKVRLLSDEISSSIYNYNFSGDGESAVSFEASQIYQGLISNFSKYKNEIEEAGGDNSIFNLDIPTIEEFYDLGYIDRSIDEKDNNYKYTSNSNTPTWLTKGDWFTKSITNNQRSVYVYAISNGLWRIVNVYDSNGYGISIRAVLETSISNLTIIDTDIDDNTSDDSNDNNNTQDEVQTVNVPSTGANTPIIFLFVGLGILAIAGIIIWVLVKDKKGQK